MAEKIVKLMQGNEACVEGAIAAGMNFYAGYPITPSTDIAEMSAARLPRLGGKFIQMEDEIASIAAVVGASLTGKKVMTATSGPGFSLKQEGIGYAIMTETPVVIVDVQRGGPSTGMPTSPSQGDIMQARWGSHGDHSIIAIYPATVREVYEKTIRAFNLAEKYRTPVILLMDEVIGQMREKIEFSPDENLEIYNRKKPTVSPNEYKPYKIKQGEYVSEMAAYGEGYRFHTTGLVHDETGFPTSDREIAADLISRLVNKIEDNADDIVEYEEYRLEDANEMIVAYGVTARAAKSAIDILREDGRKIGLFRPITIWPSAGVELKELSKKMKKISVIEMNLGQYFTEVQRIAGKFCQVDKYGRADGELVSPDEIIDFVKK